MNTSLFATIYAAVLHLTAIISVVVLISLGKIDQTAGFAILAGLLGFAVGVPVSVNKPPS